MDYLHPLPYSRHARTPRHVTDRFGDCRRDAADTEFGDTLWPSSAMTWVALFEEEYFPMRNVEMDQRLDAAHLARNAIIPLFPEFMGYDLRRGGLIIREPFQPLEIFETLDRQQLRIGLTCFAAQSDKALQACSPRIILVDTAVDQQVDAPGPSKGRFSNIRAVHPAHSL